MVQTQVDLTPENNRKVKQHMLDKNFSNKSDAINDIVKRKK